MTRKLPKRLPGKRSFGSRPMCGSLRIAARHGSAGFSLVSAIFLMVVLVVLGTSIVTLSAVQHSTSAMRIQTLRAHYMARAGLEWAIKWVSAGGANCVASSNFVLENVQVSVVCNRTVHNLNGAPTGYDVITATASSGIYGGIDYVSRQLQAKVIGP